MTTNAMIGHGTEFAILDTSSSPEAYVAVAEVTSVTPPALARDAVDATHTASTEGWRDFIPGLKDAGEASFEMNFVPDGEAVDLIMTAFNSNDVQDFQITFPDGSPGTQWQFKGIITAFEPEAPVDDKIMATVTVKLTGKPAFVSA